MNQRLSILSRRLAMIMMLGDVVAIIAAFGAAVFLADALRLLLDLPRVSTLQFVSGRGVETALLSGLAIIVFAFGGLYRREGWELNEVRQIFAGIGLVALFDATLQFAVRDHDSRFWFAIAYPLAAFFVVGMRMALRSLPRMREAAENHVILLGEGASPEVLVNELRGSLSAPVSFLAPLSLSALSSADERAVGRRLDECAAAAGVPSHKVITVLAPTIEEMAHAQHVLERLNEARRPYSVLLPYRGLARRGLKLRTVLGADIVLAEMDSLPNPRLALTLKRAFDIVAALGLLVALSPFILAVAIRLAALRGPVFFRQRRVGRGGAVFTCFKFRSMRPDAEEALAGLLADDADARREWETFQKLKDDPRVTGSGAFLRRTSLDEAPQLINVLRGEMSLVGPRPIVVPEAACYPNDRAYFESPEFENYARWRPGITGLWQVSGRASTSHEERVRLDRWYNRNWSVWLDLVVLFRTIGAVLGRRGSH